ncbi:MAG: hypothetical protein SVC26_04950 [Pseudomonadota bacterium]|nr:hypothetical protein [Pseudomonadota bacterium]
MRHCILHIGTEKTGTTSLQASLSKQRHSLQEQRVYYSPMIGKHIRSIARFALDRSRKQAWLKIFFPATQAQDQRWRAQFIQRWREEMAALPDTCRYVISSEFLAWMLTSPQELMSIKKELDTYFDQIKVVCYLRRPDRFALSFCSTALKNGVVLPEILPTKWAHSPRFNYLLLVMMWARVFGKNAMRIYSYDQNKHQLHLHFSAQVLGLTERPLQAVNEQQVNPSLSTIALPAYQAFLRQFDAPRPINKFQHFMETNYAGRLPMTRAEAKAYADQFTNDIKKIERLFGLEPLFDDNFDDYPEQLAAQDEKWLQLSKDPAACEDDCAIQALLHEFCAFSKQERPVQAKPANYD